MNKKFGLFFMTSTQNPADKIIVALDGMNRNEALAFISKLPSLQWVKVGLELFVNAGPEILEELRDKGLKIFLDLKFHDIPNTMSATCKCVARSGAQLITVHGCAGIKALKQSNKAASEGALEVGLPQPTLLAVTVLSSWDSNNFSRDLAINHTIKERVIWLADLASKVGIGGCICSPQEVKILRKLHPEPFQLVTPGIRFNDDQLDDQSRVMNPREAIDLGASRLVIGRPITASSDPAKAFRRFCSSLNSDYD